jgi:hypothetical protein
MMQRDRNPRPDYLQPRTNIMPAPPTVTQAPRNATTTVAMTEEEKRAVRGVAAALKITESDALRDYTMAAILERFERIRAAVGGGDSAA